MVPVLKYYRGIFLILNSIDQLKTATILTAHLMWTGYVTRKNSLVDQQLLAAAESVFCKTDVGRHKQTSDTVKTLKCGE